MKILKIFSAILLSIAGSISVAQTQPSPNLTYSTTPNLLNPTVNAWTGTVQGQNGGFSGGNTPAFNPNTNTIIFGYTQATAMQTIAINQALSGTGIQVGGYNYSWNINNDPATGQYGTLTGRVDLKGAGGNTLQTYNYNYPQRSGGFINFSGTQWFPQDYTLANLSTLELSFTGKDATFWAGYYGPQVRTPSLTLRYTVDPCATNPAYSPSCPGYNTVSISNNLLPGTTGTQAYAINQALAFAGAGAMIHGFDWGYNYSVAGRQCAIWDLFGFCLSGYNYSDAGVSTVITDSNNATIYSESSTHNGGNNGTVGVHSRQYRFSSSLPMSTLGGFAMSPWTLGNASITNMYSNAVYTADPCTANPLHAPSCSGYAAAYLTQQCTASPLYDPSCPGYAQAYFTQQCTINQLYSPNCPGYAAAYLTQQCTANPLYSPSCPGYATAYLAQQCSANPLYDAACPGYQTATAQCTANPLTAAYCPNYQSSLTSCTRNGLIYSYCPTYQSELNYCTTDPLSNNLCPTYQTATAQCSANPLTAAYCPNYQTATASCAANSLNHSYCPGYSAAANTCSTNPLSNTMCSGYTTATNACSANSLTYTYCPNYTTALSSCSTNPQSNTKCPGYSSSSSSASGGGTVSGPTNTARSTTEASVAIGSTGRVETSVSKTGDSNVDSVISRDATSSSPADRTAAVNLTSQPSTSVSTPNQMAGSPAGNLDTAPRKEETRTADGPQPREEKKEDTKTASGPSSREEKKEEKKEQSRTADSSSSTGISAEQKKEPTKTARQELHERRVEAARAKAVEDGKQLAGKMGEAATLESQIAVQNVVIQAMGFTPGFDTYNRFILPDAIGYRPFEIYPGQRVIDNPQGRRFMTGSDRLHTEMVDQQYKRSE